MAGFSRFCNLIIEMEATMSLKQQLTDDMKTAMKAGEKDRLGVIRLINAAIKQKEVDERIDMTDPLVLAVLEKMVKQRKDSITQFEAAAREDLAAIERFELGVIEAYLPASFDEAAIVAGNRQGHCRHRRSVCRRHGQADGRAGSRRWPGKPTWAWSASW